MIHAIIAALTIATALGLAIFVGANFELDSTSYLPADTTAVADTLEVKHDNEGADNETR